MSSAFPTQWALLTVRNLDTTSHDFYYEICESSDAGTVRYSGGPFSVGAGAVYTIIGGNWSSYYGKNACFRVKQSGGSTCSFQFAGSLTGYASHGHGSHAHGMDHTHSLASHTHGMDHTHSLASHTHGMAHTHGMDHNHGSHTHNLVYGIYESAVPATVRVYLDGTLITALNDLTLVSDFDLLPYVTKDSNGRVAEGWHTLEFTSATAGATGSVRGCLFQRKFISTEAA